ncbi:hypothetical protein [Acidisoma cladoniae]|uniref:hypothetical protein n=1 Tax=Acidisoma cladoniae TaxID=3040935 RepID=UPI0025518A9C|nr:hypothetical protein [Acidisoma sp. PAMC 29798]
MPVLMPQVHWPKELQEEGPNQDPSILLGGAAEIGGTSYRIHAMRINLDGLEPDFQADVEEAVYAEYRIDVIFEELIFLDDFDGSSTLSLDTGNYILWMNPVSSASRAEDLYDGCKKT